MKGTIIPSSPISHSSPVCVFSFPFSSISILSSNDLPFLTYFPLHTLLPFTYPLLSPASSVPPSSLLLPHVVVPKPSSIPSAVSLFTPLCLPERLLNPFSVLFRLSSQWSRTWTAPPWRPTIRALPAWWSSGWLSCSWWPADRVLGRCVPGGPPLLGATPYRLVAFT